MKHQNYDIAIIGSGYAASLLAMIARRLNHSVVMLEKSRHPRFAIGESSTPLANLLLEELALRYDLPRVLPLAKWGSWQKNYPEIGCGLKRGFSFYHHQRGQKFQSKNERENELLVAASPNNNIADTHWFRADFDHLLLKEAQKLGVDYLDETTLNAPQRDDENWFLSGERHDKKIALCARLLIDASGPRGFLHRALGLTGERVLPTQVLYSHFRDVRLFADVINAPDNVPFPIDDAALHHVFDGGWMWVLRFNNGITSAGISVNDNLASELNLGDAENAWQRILARLPSVAAQFEKATPVRPFAHSSAPSFRSDQVAGDDWALLPSSAGFSDPLLSTGFPLALAGVARLGSLIENAWTKPLNEPLQKYAAQTQRELCAVEQLVGALYQNLNDFEVFSALTMLYFAAASFSETARRLNKSHLSGAFLLCDHPQFGPQMRACLTNAMPIGNASDKAVLLKQIAEIIKPFDVVGIGAKNRRNWYPVRAQDLFDARAKVGATHNEIAALLQRCGF